MKAFTLQNPRTLEAAVALLSDEQHGRARPLSGGQDLLTELKERLDGPERLVNLKSVPGLDGLTVEDERIEIGALVTLARLERDERLRARWRGLAEAAASIASPQIRSCATVGGNLCQRPRCWYYRHEGAVCIKKGGSECFAYGGLNKYNAILGGGPSYIVHPSDLAPALVSYEAEVVLTGPGGERILRLADFYTLPSEGDVTRETVLAPNEILTSVRIPGGMSSWRSTYLKVRERGAFDFALAAVALAVHLEEGKIRNVRLTLGGVAPRPWRVPAAEQVLLGNAPGEALFAAAAEAALAGAEPLAHNAYKIPMTKGLVQKALRKLTS
jgi:xanthine dehydrogenase YagS FAD-binding subunit